MQCLKRSPWCFRGSSHQKKEVGCEVVVGRLYPLPLQNLREKNDRRDGEMLWYDEWATSTGTPLSFLFSQRNCLVSFTNVGRSTVHYLYYSGTTLLLTTPFGFVVATYNMRLTPSSFPEKNAQSAPFSFPEKNRAGRATLSFGR